MCHQVLAEANKMATCTSAEYREFQQRWADVFDQSGRKEIAQAMAQYAARLGNPRSKKAQERLAAVAEDLLFGFGLSLLATACGACTHAGKPPAPVTGGTGARRRNRSSGPRA